MEAESSTKVERTLLIHNCDSSITGDEIRAIFACMGEILHLKKQFNVKHNAFCWYLEYANKASAKDAIEALQGYELVGKEMQIAFDGDHSEDEPVSRAAAESVVETGMRDFFDSLVASDEFATIKSIPDTHQKHIEEALRSKVDDHDERIHTLAEKIANFLETNREKTFQSKLYADFKEIAPESTHQYIEKSLNDAYAAETAFANSNYLFFEQIPENLTLDEFRKALLAVIRCTTLKVHECAENNGRRIIADFGCTQINTRVAALQVLIVENECIKIHVARKNA